MNKNKPTPLASSFIGRKFVFGGIWFLLVTLGLHPIAAIAVTLIVYAILAKAGEV